MMTTPLVSVIVPVGPRHSDHCRTAAASVKWQSLAHLCETILIEDGDAHIAPMDGVTILRSDGKRRGPAYTRNRGIDIAKGGFIIPLDSDDYLLPHAVETLLREYARGDRGYIYGDAFTQERDGRFIYRSAPDYVQEHLARYNIHVVTTLMPTRYAREVGGFDERIDAWEDWTFHLRLAIAGVCGHRVPQPILTYRVYEGDRMTRFYGGAPEHMEAVWTLYRNKEGNIPMSSCCGGDGPLVDAAQQAVMGAPMADPAPMAGGLVRVEYIGEDRGAQTWEHPFGTPIRLGNNAVDRFKDVTPEQAEWLRDHNVPIRVVPLFDKPDPPQPMPILGPQDALTADQTGKALRP